jgi:CheY-like chemotaxis protein
MQSQPGQGSTFTLYLPEELHSDQALPMVEISEADLTDRVASPSAQTAQGDDRAKRAASRPRAETQATQQARLADQPAVLPQQPNLPDSVSSLLIVEHGSNIVTTTTAALNGRSMHIETASTGHNAYELLQTSSFDCMIIGMEPSGISANELLDMLDEDTGCQETMPVIVYAAHPLPPSEQQLLRQHSRSRIVEIVATPERLTAILNIWLLSSAPKPETFHVPEEVINLLADEESATIDIVQAEVAARGPVGDTAASNSPSVADAIEHIPEDLLPEEDILLDEVPIDGDVTRELQQVEELLLEQQQELRMFRSKDAVLNRRIILVVSRERANVYTLTNVLQEKGVQVVFAEDSTEVMQQLESRSTIDLVLVENVLPNKDGCEVIRTIRAQPRYVKLPIIALMVTTKPEDYQRCLDAGANDYVFKPVDTDELLSLLRVWLY